ncbi:hypothetical protein V8C35DRAFT_289087 [Trichoderma chlorosporum]
MARRRNMGVFLFFLFRFFLMVWHDFLTFVCDAYTIFLFLKRSSHMHIYTCCCAGGCFIIPPFFYYRWHLTLLGHS